MVFINVYLIVKIAKGDAEAAERDSGSDGHQRGSLNGPDGACRERARGSQWDGGPYPRDEAGARTSQLQEPQVRARHHGGVREEGQGAGHLG